jgi:hypothetical protein
MKNTAAEKKTYRKFILVENGINRMGDRVALMTTRAGHKALPHPSTC